MTGTRTPRPAAATGARVHGASRSCATGRDSWPLRARGSGRCGRVRSSSESSSSRDCRCSAADNHMAMVEPPADPNGQLVLRFMAGTSDGDFDAIADLVHDDFVMEWPQSGERFSGRDNAFAAMRAQRDKPEVAGPAWLVGSGDTWVIMMPLRYGEDLFHYTAVLE